MQPLSFIPRKYRAFSQLTYRAFSQLTRAGVEFTNFLHAVNLRYIARVFTPLSRIARRNT
jgi:hypothetical protein